MPRMSIDSPLSVKPVAHLRVFSNRRREYRRVWNGGSRAADACHPAERSRVPNQRVGAGARGGEPVGVARREVARRGGGGGGRRQHLGGFGRVAHDRGDAVPVVEEPLHDEPTDAARGARHRDLKRRGA